MNEIELSQFLSQFFAIPAFLLSFAVIYAWYYAYRKTGLKALKVLGIAALIGLAGSLITPLLMGFTNIDSFIIRTYTMPAQSLTSLASKALTLIGILRLVKEKATVSLSSIKNSS